MFSIHDHITCMADRHGLVWSPCFSMGRVDLVQRIHVKSCTNCTQDSNIQEADMQETVRCESILALKNVRYRWLSAVLDCFSFSRSLVRSAVFQWSFPVSSHSGRKNERWIEFSSFVLPIFAVGPDHCVLRAATPSFQTMAAQAEDLHAPPKEVQDHVCRFQGMSIDTIVWVIFLTRIDCSTRRMSCARLLDGFISINSWQHGLKFHIVDSRRGLWH